MASLTAKQLAETYTKAAQINWETDGHLTPIVHFTDGWGGGVSLIPNGDRFHGQAREQLSALIMLSADIVPALVFVSTCVEAWMRAYPMEEGRTEPPSLERGQLSKGAETDPDVKTSLVVQVYDVRNYANSHSIMSTWVGDPREPAWDEHANEGLMDGAMPEMIQGAISIARDPQRRAMMMGPLTVDGDTIEDRIRFLADIGFIVAGMAAIAEPKQN